MSALPSLPEVTLCCVETRFPELAAFAIRRSLAQARFGRAVWLTTAAIAATQPVQGLACEVQLIDDLRSIDDYSRFVLQTLPDLVHTPFALIIQWDGFVLDGRAWDPGFLQCDYIGAVWPWETPGRRVGNGGFSLRSLRLMKAVQALAADGVEDLVICHRLRPALEQQGLRFADEATARRFSFEILPPQGPSFGFHGVPNLPLALARTELDAYVERLPAALALSAPAAELALRLLERGQREAARTLVRHRLTAGLADEDTRQLMLRCWERQQPCFCASGRAFRHCHGRLA